MDKILVFFKIILAGIIAIFTMIGSVFGSSQQPSNAKMMAHRGYSDKYPENTALAFTEAAKNGAEGVETDLRVTKDGIYVLNHNDTIILNDGSELSVADNTFADLTSKPLKNKKTNDEVYLCSFEDFLDIMKKYNLEYYIEFKIPCTDELIKDVFTIAKNKYDINKCIFESPRINDLISARTLFPDLPLMFVINDNKADYSKCFEYNISVDVQYYVITTELIDEFHSRNLKVGAWTCDNFFTLSYARSLGVDYIESNVYCE